MTPQKAGKATSNAGAPQVAVFSTPAEVAQAVADECAKMARDCVRQTGRFTLALAGGNTPRQAYQRFPVDLPWGEIHLFFGDERPVPPDDANSNYRMVKESLLSRVSIPAENVHRIRAELGPDVAARKYEEEIHHFLGDAPMFDLVLLGMGGDGHTASLFPGSAALQQRSHLVVANWVEKLQQSRITLTLPVLNYAARVMFVVVGADKASVVQEVLGGESNQHYPVQLVRPVSGWLRWMLDTEAARLLQQIPKAS
jgi:6-phosphogluconolactonase